MGGILELIGIDGFLDNMQSVDEDSTDDQFLIEQIVEIWYKSHGTEQIRASMIADIMSNLTNEEYCSQQAGFSINNYKNDVILDKYRVRSLHKSGSNVYFLELIDNIAA